MPILKNLKGRAEENTFFRQVMATGQNTQIVIMSIPPGGEIGQETHPDNDQVLCLVKGAGRAVIGGEETDFNMGDMALVPAGTEHNFITAGDEPMQIITFYSPPHHPEGTVHKTKEEADAVEAHEQA